VASISTSITRAITSPTLFLLDWNKPVTKPFWWHAFRRYNEVVKVLLAQHDVDPNYPNTRIQHHFIMLLSIFIIRFLIIYSNIASNPSARDGSIPHQSTITTAHKKVINLLPVGMSLQNLDSEPPTSYEQFPAR